jgi:V/A-type H+-transporting ATPase subunit I
MKDPSRMLVLSLYWGIGFIVLSTMIAIRNRVIDGHVLEALFDGRGLAGISAYLGLLWGSYSGMVYGQFGSREEFVILIPLVLVLSYKWYESDFPPQERMLVILIEGFDSMMGYFSNTLSFLRVAAFSLNHVALAFAVFAIAEMMGTTGHWLTVVFGNIFIMVLEGGVVAIQVLRLEYYESFSRFLVAMERSLNR